MIRLTVSRDADKPLVFEFDQDEVLIGRVAPADVVLDSEGVSRRHARVSRRPEGWRMADLGAPNGVYVLRKGLPPPQRVIVEEIASNDVITIERYHILFEDFPGLAARPRLDAGEKLEFGDPFTRVTTLPGFQRPNLPAFDDKPAKALAAARAVAGTRLDAAVALSAGAPVQQLARADVPLPPGRPSLEVYEKEGQPPRAIALGNAPIQFGSDPTCDVRITGLTTPRFVASASLVGRRLQVSRLSSGLLGPKLSVDNQAVRQAELEDGQKFFVGAICCILKVPRA